MLPFDEIKKYSSEVLSQIRWKKAKPMIASEIENHIVDQSDEYMDMGENEETSTIKAIEQMGDPIAIGKDLDKNPMDNANIYSTHYDGRYVGRLCLYFV